MFTQGSSRLSNNVDTVVDIVESFMLFFERVIFFLIAGTYRTAFAKTMGKINLSRKLWFSNFRECLTVASKG